MSFITVQSSPRGSPYQDNINIRRRNSSLYGVQQLFRWALSSDSEQNAAVRNEFSYEQVSFKINLIQERKKNIIPNIWIFIIFKYQNITKAEKGNIVYCHEKIPKGRDKAFID